MKRFLDKAKQFVDEHDFPGREQVSQHLSQQQQQQPMQQHPAGGPTGIQPPTPADIFRYRYHHGANLGALFIAERWLSGALFPEGSEGSAELAAVKAQVEQHGVETARENFERHWNEWIREEDLAWLRDEGRCTTVRLPIGYFTLGPAFCADTPFEEYAGVYEHAWGCVKRLVGRLHGVGVVTVIDVHGLPGGANAQEHSGSNLGRAEFWEEKEYRRLATRCLCFIAQEARGMEGVAGIQIINEAEWDAKGMYGWYDAAIAEMSRVDATMPVYVSDGWDLNRCVEWSQGKNAAPQKGGAWGQSPVVVDTHYYWCFSEEDKGKSPQQISHEVWGKMGALDGKDGAVLDRGAAGVVVGEYSCVLADATWENGGGKTDELVRGFGQAESARWQQRAGGSFFWTYRMDWMDGGEWGFKQMTRLGAITPPPGLTLADVAPRIQHAQAHREAQKQQAYQGHCGYWDSQGGHYEHERFAEGWDVGFHDAMAFFGMRSQGGACGGGAALEGGDKIGLLDLWVLKRLRESGVGGKSGWEWEQGFRQGVGGFCQLVGI